MLTDKQQTAAAKAFAKRWKGEHSEDQDGRSFWIDLLQSVYGIEQAINYIQFEKRVKSKSTQRIDAYIPATKVLIEQKSSNVPLDLPVQRGPYKKPITPYGQAKEYDDHLPYHEKSEWIITCNFKELWIYDMKEPENIRKPLKIELSNLARDFKHLRFLVDNRSDRLIQEEEISVKAGELVKKMYNLLELQYPELDEHTRRNLNILCVRIVFCLYAEDAGVFDFNQFHDYLVRYDAADFSERLEKLFEVLNTPEEKRSLALSEHLKDFPYTNGGLFAEKIQVPPFTEELRDLILDKASLGFNWSNISPTIFGALFESTINPETRKKGGMHYTSIENIHKVIDPLFLNDLKQELEGCLKKRQYETDASQQIRLSEFQDKLASLSFLDPACGSGNFLTETYLSLRELENVVIQHLSIAKDKKGKRYKGMGYITTHNPIKVSINQFYGIEYNDFAVSVASVALWISEAKMLQETEGIVGHEITFLPLKNNANIVEGNALRTEWPTADYIIGNPPFLGYSNQTEEQKADVRMVYSDKNGRPYNMAGKIDYVACWYMKAARLMADHPETRAAFVSTNSITQGEQVSAVWRPLVDDYKLHIDFAHRTFRWDNEATENAHVHCVIVGFHCEDTLVSGKIFDGDKIISANHINPYLLDFPDVWIEPRRNPLCDVPVLMNGGKPTEGGFLILTEPERDELLKANPKAERFIRPYMMGEDFIQRRPRYCLWLVGISPDELMQCPLVLKRISQVRDYRLESKKAATRRKADTPMLFDEVRECTSDYVAIPKVSSENRRYVPMDFLSKDIIPGDKLFMLPSASLYSFGIMTSSVHMAWMRTVCGRLEMRYSYSNTVVYNNFPWPTPTKKQKAAIEETAKAILDARALYPNSNLAEMYGEQMYLYPELLKAHKANDLAVMKAYGFSPKLTEEEIVSSLFKMYQELVSSL